MRLGKHKVNTMSVGHEMKRLVGRCGGFAGLLGLIMDEEEMA